MCGDYRPALDATCAYPWQIIVFFELEEDDVQPDD